MLHYIEDRVVIITGGSRGYGFSTAKFLLEMKANVVITGRDRTQLGTALAELSAIAGAENVMAHPLEATVGADWDALFAAVLERFGKIDILVNNHGAAIKLAETENMSDDDFRKILDVNLTSVLMGCQRVIPIMKKNGRGTILNISSGCATKAWGYWASYTAAKAGLVGFSKCLHKEMETWGGRAMCFLPGAGQTGFCDAANITGFDLTGFPTADDVARTIVFCLDQPDSCVLESVSQWGTKQITGITPW